MLLLKFPLQSNKMTRTVLVSLLILAIGGCTKPNMENSDMDEVAQWHQPEDSTPQEQCPCCDYITLTERGLYEICPVCFWEDDGQDINKLDQPSYPNSGITLREGRNNFKEFGACEKHMVEHVLNSQERSKFSHRPRNPN
tara:strand:- start:1042 stop:1461 length:420 start_codon:yes stop_codon:yes gene_type:complete